MARRPFVAGNWKLNKTVAEALELVKELTASLGSVKNVDVAVAPAYTAIHAVAGHLSGSNIAVAGQNLFWEKQGAYTGTVSGQMLKEAGSKYVIVGHSERRQYFAETDATAEKRVQAALESGLEPILCVGETLEEREAGKTLEKVNSQLAGALNGLSVDQFASLTIAYEPVWAIGTGRTATTQQAQEVHQAIRNWLRDKAGKVAEQIRIQYGGSVNSSNAAELMAQPDVDGALVGGASLQAESFAAIVKAAE